MITPSAETIARAIARREGVNVQVSGARAANALGLSTQVPGRATFLTEGTSRRRRVGGLTLELRRTVPKRMSGAGRPAGVAIEALRHLGPHDATTAAVDHVLAKLRPEDQEDFMRLILSAPEWLRKLVNDSTSAKRSRNEGERFNDEMTLTEISHLAPEDRRELFRRTTASGAGPGDAMMVEKDY